MPNDHSDFSINSIVIDGIVKSLPCGTVGNFDCTNPLAHQAVDWPRLGTHPFPIVSHGIFERLVR